MILLLQLKEGIYYYLILITLFSKSYSCFDRYLEMLLFSYFYPPPPTERGRHFLIWSIRVNAAEQGMVSEPLSLKQGIRFHLWLASSVGCLVRRNPLRECKKFGDETSTFGANNFCFSKKFKSMTLLWKITQYNFYADWNEIGSKRLGLLSYTGIAQAKCIISVSNRVRVWRTRRHTSTPTALEGPPRALLIKRRRKID